MILLTIEDARFAGPQSYILNLLKNIEVSYHLLIPTSDNTIFKMKLLNHNIKFTEIKLTRPNLSSILLIKYIINFIPDILRLISTIRKLKPKYVYCCGGSWQIKSLIATFFSKSKFVWHLNDTYLPDFILFVFKFLAKFPDGFVFASNSTASYYSRFITAKPCITIQSPINIDYLYKCRVNAPDKLINIVTVCSINPVKNLEYFIRIAQELLKIKNNIKFTILGSAPSTQYTYFESLKSLIDKHNIDKIQFAGFSDSPLNFLNSSDIYLCTSHNESSPIAVWEAMLTGNIVLSTSVGDVPNFIQNGHNGFIIPSHSPYNVAYLINSICCNIEKFEFIRVNARQLAITKFNPDICKREHLSFFKTLNS